MLVKVFITAESYKVINTKIIFIKFLILVKKKKYILMHLGYLDYYYIKSRSMIIIIMIIILLLTDFKSMSSILH